MVNRLASQRSACDQSVENADFPKNFLSSKHFFNLSIAIWRSYKLLCVFALTGFRLYTHAHYDEVVLSAEDKTNSDGHRIHSRRHLESSGPSSFFPRPSPRRRGFEHGMPLRIQHKSTIVVESILISDRIAVAPSNISALPPQRMPAPSLQRKIQVPDSNHLSYFYSSYLFL